METGRFLHLGIGLAAALGKLHQRGLVHKDIKPSHILVDCADGQVRLTGFGIASRLPRERQAPEPPEFIAGTLAYMAPEQTGRMNRSVDARSARPHLQCHLTRDPAFTVRRDPGAGEPRPCPIPIESDDARGLRRRTAVD
jgi:serine/threonine protein kinase